MAGNPTPASGRLLSRDAEGKAPMKVVAENGHSRHMLSDIGYGAPELSHGRLSSSGSLAMLAAMRRASSRVSRCAAERRPGSYSKIDVSERLPINRRG